MGKRTAAAILACFCWSFTAMGHAGVDVNVNVRGGLPAPPAPRLPAPPPPPGLPAPSVQVVKVKKDNGKHLGHYKEKKGKKHGKREH